MCLRALFGGAPKPQVAAPMLIPATNNAEAERQMSLEESLRRRRRGAAADVLTSPTGIPARRSVAQLGGAK